LPFAIGSINNQPSFTPSPSKPEPDMKIASLLDNPRRKEISTQAQHYLDQAANRGTIESFFLNKRQKRCCQSFDACKKQISG